MKWQAIIAVVVALYSASLYRDRFKLRSFPMVARTFWKEGWSLDRMPRLDGKVALITGANSGLGLQSAVEMHAAGAHVVMACRNLDRCTAAMESLNCSGTGCGTAETLQLDLGSFASVREAAQTFLQGGAAAGAVEGAARRLDILLLNAGGILQHSLTVDGIEQSFQVCHLSHFLLTRLLLPALKRSAPSRVVSVTSDAHQYSYRSGILGRPDMESINDGALTNSAQNYAQAKLANILFATELSRRLGEEEDQNQAAAAGQGRGGGVRRVYVNAAHPGLVASSFVHRCGPAPAQTAVCWM
jgi:NAD(P)-dependent dehydrogenase (short-subunit alcohol dehydrogenase family)